MVAVDRKMRSKRQATFLEHVKDLLDTLCNDMSEIKFRLDGLQNLAKENTCFGSSIAYADSGTRENLVLVSKGAVPIEEMLPPPAPPALDCYNRNYLLACRKYDLGDEEFCHLPKCLSLDTISDVLSSSIDDPGNQYTYLFPSGEVDEITDFLRAQGHYDLDKSEHIAKATIDSLDIHTRIDIAQKAAVIITDRSNMVASSSVQLERQCQAVKRMQRFWKTCKLKVLGTWPVEKVNSFASSEEPRTGSSHLSSNVGNIPSHMKYNRTNKEITSCKFSALDIEVQGIVTGIFEMSSQVPESKLSPFIFKGYRGLAERHHLTDVNFQRGLEFLEARLNTRCSEVLPYTCQECAETYEAIKDCCDKCGCHDIFDVRQWITKDSEKLDLDESICSTELSLSQFEPTSKEFDIVALETAINICIASCLPGSQTSRNQAAPYLIKVCKSLQAHPHDIYSVIECFDIYLDTWRDKNGQLKKSVVEFADEAKSKLIHLCETVY